jgi:hypothetical protein
VGIVRVGRKRKPAPAGKKPGAGSRRYVRREWATVYRDPKTGVLCQVGPDQGTEQRRQHQLGVATLKRWDINDAGRAYFTTGSFALGTSVFDAMHRTGFLYTRLPREDAVGPFCSLSAADLALAELRFEAGEDFAALCRAAGISRRLTAGYEFRTDAGTVEVNARALRARRLVVDRALRLGDARFHILLDVLCLDRVPDLTGLLAFVEALDAYAKLLRLSGATRGG